jgi:hypothetical protein
MARPTTTFSVTAPGFMGLNTADSPVDMDGKFALEVNNCVIDKFGRVGSRQGWTTAHTASAGLGSNDVESIGELVENDGTRTIVVAGGNKIFKLVGTTLTELTYGGGGVAPTITSSNWDTCMINNAILFFQDGNTPLLYDTALSTTTYRRISEHPGYTGTVQQANVGLSAYGRIWNARTTTDKNTLQWSDTLTHHKWTGGSAGTLNLYGVWPQGGDEIVALAAHNNRLIIFGARQILIYSGADDPSGMVLEDAISNSGCAGRDTVQNTPDDVIFLSSGGLRSIRRTIQEKSAPLTVVSRTVNGQIQDYLVNESSGSTIKSVYSPLHSFYLLTFVNSNATYCFDTKVSMPDGSYRVTTWSGVTPKCYCYSLGRTLYFGQAGYLATYGGYFDNGAVYRMSYYTPWIDFGDPVRTSILKKISTTIFGAFNQTITHKWGFDYVGQSASEQVSIGDSFLPAEYNSGEYGIAEYTNSLVIDTVSTNTGGSGKVVQVGVECEVNGQELSVQRIDVYTKNGAYK